MFDIKLIRHDPDAFDAAIGRRGIDPVAKKILDIDREKRLMLTALQEAQSRRNEVSQKVGAAKAAGENADALIAEMTTLKSAIKAQETEERTISAELDGMMAALPNIPNVDVPDGESEDDNKVVRTEGEKPVFDFSPAEHFDLGAALGLMDFDAAAKMSGSRFVILKGALARLERALGQFMLDLHTTDHGYQEASVPSLVKDAALFGTGQLPKFAEDLFRTEQGYWMIPTAEVPLTNIGRDSILAEHSLPIRTVALTPCYRSEAGAAGKDTRGMIRQHQFSKVEMVSIVAPEDGDGELERMTGCAEAVLKALDLAYQVVELCTGDMGFAARKTYDLEVWLPGQNGGEGRYREISSCSLCGDFQARRMNMRYQPSGKKGTIFPHTLNGSGLAVGRTLIAVMENYQLDDGSIIIPDILKPYMGGIEVIGPGIIEQGK